MRSVSGRWIFAGLDQGRTHVAAALAVVERTASPVQNGQRAARRSYFVSTGLRFLEPLPADTSDMQISAKIASLIRSHEFPARSQVVLAVAGAGRPLVNLLREARLPAHLFLTLITGGVHDPPLQPADNSISVSMRDLITGLDLQLAMGALQIPTALPRARELMREIADLTGAMSLDAAHDGIYREDIAGAPLLAVALACWGMRKVYPTGRSSDIEGSMLGSGQKTRDLPDRGFQTIQTAAEEVIACLHPD